MPITRKLTTVGESRGITLPKSWLSSHEKEHHCKIIEIALEVDGQIILQPIFEEKKQSEEVDHECPE